MNAMTWFDHQTESIWSQPWGMAIAGPMKGTQLRMLPVSLEPWGSWWASHPGTQVVDINGSFMYAGEEPRAGFVIGVMVGGQAKAYGYATLVREGLVNDAVGGAPVVVLADPESRAIRAYVRDTGSAVLAFSLDAGRLVDAETGSVWDPVRGVATEGPLKGIALQPAPYLSAFADSWTDFYPGAPVYDGME